MQNKFCLSAAHTNFFTLMKTEKKFLFITGCARSGTSALVQLLSGSRSILLGMERFGHLIHHKDDFKLRPHHFYKSRFYDLQKGDTFYENLADFHKFDELFFDKYESASYIGDKRPDLYEAYDSLFEHFPQCIVLFIYRNLEEVASSFKGRVIEGQYWPATKDFKAAVLEWNRSLFLTKNAMPKGTIRMLSYHEIFKPGANLSPIFKFLDIEEDDRLNQRVLQIQERSADLRKKRTMLLSPEEIDYVKSNGKIFLIKELEDIKINCV